MLLEDAIDIHDRHWKIHWMLNFAQFASTQALNGLLEEEKGEAAGALMGRPWRASVADRNWDSIEDLWDSEEIKDDAELAAAFEGETMADIMAALEGRARPPLRRAAHRPAPEGFGYKAIWSHEFAFKTWREDPALMIEAVRGYLATDYDYPSNIAPRARTSRLRSARRSRGGGRRAAGGARALAQHEPAPRPTTLLHRPGHERPAAILLIAIGEKLVDAGTLDDPEDVMFLRYNELRC